MGRKNRIFGHMPDGTAVEEVALSGGGLSCGVITYGGALRTLTVPDRAGRPVDVVLGLDTLEDYRAQDKFLGALVGRYANRIGGSRFTLEGRTYPLPANDGANHLHGGPEGFDKKVWTIRGQTDSSVTLSLLSPDGEAGYPGELTVTAVYALRDGALEISYRAEATETTLCNLTNHAYFNLSGHDSGPVDGHSVQVLADRYTPVGAGLIPTGAVETVEGTPMDLRTLQPLGEREFDHNWAVSGWDGALRPAARAWSPDTGIAMETLTTLPGIQFYTGNFLDGCPAGKGGASYVKHGAFCLETQFFPDSPNQPSFPSAVLAKGQTYVSKTVYRFSTQK